MGGKKLHPGPAETIARLESNTDTNVEPHHCFEVYYDIIFCFCFLSAVLSCGKAERRKGVKCQRDARKEKKKEREKKKRKETKEKRKKSLRGKKKRE